MSYTPYNAPILSGLLGDPDVTKWFSVKAEFEAFCRFEAALAQAEAEAGLIPEDAAIHITACCDRFEPDLAAINEAVSRDGLPVPEFVRQLKKTIGQPYAEHLHFGTTSQDLIDTSLILRLARVNEHLLCQLGEVIDALDQLTTEFGARPLMGRTRMQAAIPIKVADRIEIWARPLRGHQARFEALAPALMALQFGGPAGTLDTLGDAAQSVSKLLAEKLGLRAPERCWHTDRSRLADYASWLSVLTGSLGKIGHDITLMAQNGIDEIRIEGGGGSSAMPHKHNPVKAEILVTLARFNAAQLGAFHQALAHEQERSGILWTLEWMILPQMCVASGAALRNAKALIMAVRDMGAPSDI